MFCHVADQNYDDLGIGKKLRDKNKKALIS
jgi:hypothetical protein